MVIARRLVQGAALLLFLALLIGSPRAWADLFFRVDPLTTGLAAVAVGAWTVSLLFVGGLLLLTLVQGRVFCGWACPLGALIDAADWSCSRPAPRLLRARQVKVYLLLALAALLGGGIALTWLLDPLVWASRIFALLGPRSIESAVSGALLLLLLALVLGLGRRGFCRVLCPLGALLGLVSRLALRKRARDGSRCTGCGRCAAHCRMGAFGTPAVEGAGRGASSHELLHQECIHCYECEDACPGRALSVAGAGRALPQPAVDRRACLLSLATAATLAGGLRLADARGRGAARSLPLRPPGSVEERHFVDLCIRCGACLRVCPSETLAPARLEAGLLAIETPVLVPRRGGCLVDCNACGQSCPTSAIRPLPLDLKRAARIGGAQIDVRRCLPFKSRRTCLVCHAACPFEAIILAPGPFKEPWGDPVRLVFVAKRRCTGCGLCEARCPVPGSAIRVVPVVPRR